MHSLLLVLLLASEPRQTQDPPATQEPIAIAKITPVAQAAPQTPIPGDEHPYRKAILDGLKSPEWWQVILIIGGTLLAWHAFNEERDAVRLTQRADVLFDGTKVSTSALGILNETTTIGMFVKNFGPTRAKDVSIKIDMEIPGVTAKADLNPKPVVIGVIATGEQRTASFPRLGNIYASDVILEASKGNRTLRVTAEIKYTDVFGKKHRTFSSGVYYGAEGTRFVSENKDEAD